MSFSDIFCLFHGLLVLAIKKPDVSLLPFTYVMRPHEWKRFGKGVGDT